MAAEIRTVAMARTTWSGPTPKDLSILANDAVCHVCAKKGHFAKDCWYQTNKRSGKGKKGKTDQGKGTNPRMVTPRRKVLATTAHEVGHFARECPKKKELNNAISSGAGDVHCLTYTHDQSHWSMMLAEVGQTRIEFLVGSGAACPCVAVQSGTWFFPRRDILDCHRSAG